MSFAEKEFEKLNEQVKMEEEKFLNAEVTIQNYKFPHIYLTDEEIEEFNKDCAKYGYDIQAIPLVTYMNLNCPDKEYQLNGEDEIDLEEKEKNIDKFMEFLGKNYHKIKEENKEDKNDKDVKDDKEEKNDKMLGKKRNKVLDDSFEEEKSVKSSLKSKSIKSNRSKKSEISEKSNLTENNLENNNEEKNNNKITKNKEKRKKINKKKNKKKTNEIKENFNNYFKKIIETKKNQEDDENRKNNLIQEIMINSQLLTKEVLNEVAKVNRFGLLDNSTTIKESDLQKKTVIELDRIKVDININSKLLKLNSDNQSNIKKIKQRQEMEQKAKEDKEEHIQKKLKEAEDKKKKNKNENKKQEKKESDISDKDSDSDDDSI